MLYLLFILSAHTVLQERKSYFVSYTGSCVLWVANTAATVPVSHFSLNIRFLFL